MEIDTFRSTRSTTSHLISPQSTAFRPSSPPPTPDSIEIELASDPLQQWVVFSPHEPIQPLLQEPIALPSMPSHDGSGHFFTSTRSSSSSSSQLSDQSFSYIDHSPPRTSSNASLSEIHSEDDDLLSIPSSISANLTGSRRSSASASNYQMSLTNPPLTAEDTELLLTPMAISAGFTEPNQARLRSCSLSSHPSNEEGARHKRTDARQRDPSRTSHQSRIKPPPLSLSSTNPPAYHPNQPPPLSPPTTLPLPLDQQKIHQQKHHSPQMLNFLSNVAYKLLDIHPDTLYLFSSSHHPQLQDQKLDLPSNHLNKNSNTFRAKRFMIGDGDSDRMRFEENQDDQIQSPLDLSGFKPPMTSLEYYDQKTSSSMLASSSIEEQGRMKGIHRTDSCETFRPKYQRKGSERKNWIRKSISDDQLGCTTTTSDHTHLDDLLPNLSRSFSSSDHLDNSRTLHQNTPSSSIAGILFRKVLDEWTNWDV